MNGLTDYIHDDWVDILLNDQVNAELASIINSLKNTKFTPAESDIFRFAKITPLSKIKVMILGQDPYPQEGVANGLAFSSENAKPQASLRNLLAVLNELGLAQITEHSELTSWSLAGIGLMNTALTTEIDSPKSHIKLWESYINKVFTMIAIKYPNIVWVLMGNDAKEKAMCLGKSTVITCAHPTARGSQFKSTAPAAYGKLREMKLNWNLQYFSSVWYTDGSCVGNHKTDKKDVVASWGAWTKDINGKIVELKGVVDGKPTNNRAELTAIIMALRHIYENGWRSRPGTAHIIKTDSQFSIKMMGWVKKWSPEERKTHENPDITEKLLDALNLFEIHRCGKLEFVYVPCHHGGKTTNVNDQIGNRRAEELAFAAVNRSSCATSSSFSAASSSSSSVTTSQYGIVKSDKCNVFFTGVDAAGTKITLAEPPLEKDVQLPRKWTVCSYDGKTIVPIGFSAYRKLYMCEEEKLDEKTVETGMKSTTFSRSAHDLMYDYCQDSMKTTLYSIDYISGEKTKLTEVPNLVYIIKPEKLYHCGTCDKYYSSDFCRECGLRIQSIFDVCLA